jgi:hypothetical protein
MTAVADERIEVQRTVNAEPSAIFRVLSDPNGHVQIDSSGMLMSATGDPVSKVGDTFVVHMDRESLNDLPLGRYDVTITIVTFERDREIAWTVGGNFDIGHVYGYRLEPADGGTLVTSYYDWSQIGDNWKQLDMFPIIPESALRATLGILARTVQSQR